MPANTAIAVCLPLPAPRSSAFRLVPPVLWLVLPFLLAAGGAATAQGLADRFDAANRLYEQGKYSEAAVAYEGLIQQHHVSAALYYNLGNALFKSGQTGQAIAAYRLAQRLAPRDPDIRANLRFARESAGTTVRTRSWQSFLQALTLNELTLMAAAALWAWLTVSVVIQVRRSSAPLLCPYRNWLAAIALVALLWLGVVADLRLGHSTAVVIVPDGVLRYGPFEEAQTFLPLHDGTELTVLSRKDHWLQVSDGSNRVGWLQAKDVTLLPRG